MYVFICKSIDCKYNKIKLHIKRYNLNCNPAHQAAYIIYIYPHIININKYINIYLYILVCFCALCTIVIPLHQFKI